MKTMPFIKNLLPAICVLLSCAVPLFAQTFQEPGAGRIQLPNGWHLTPAGESLGAGDLPLNLAISPDGRTAAVLNSGQSDQSIQLVDIAAKSVTDSISVRQSFLGLQFDAGGKTLYASGGNLNRIFVFSVHAGKLSLSDSIILGKPWPEKISPSGLAVDDQGNRLYVVTKESNSLLVIDLKTKSVQRSIPLGHEAYSCILAAGQRTLCISVWGGGEVLFVDTAADTITGRVRVGDHPNDMCLTPDGRTLFVANAQDNTVSVIDLQTRSVTETLNAALYPDAPEGSTTNGCAVSGDGGLLFVANADNNCVAVFDVRTPGQSRAKGYIPTGWYPTCVRVAGNTLWVTNGKGFRSLPDPYGPNPAKRAGKAEEGKTKRQYIGSLLRGSMSIIRIPDDKQLSVYTKAVYTNTPYSKEREKTSEGETGNPVPSRVGDPSPIRYIFYVLKENRTYDQVLADDPRGNGDTSLLLFPRRITPNEHSLAEEFVLLDNFYVDAEVSADGHNWSMAAYANDYIEKTWPTRYGGRGGEYDYIGNRQIALPKGGFIWDNCISHGVTFRNYGEFGDEGTPKPADLAKRTCPGYPGWDLAIHDTTRERIWEHDFDSLVNAGALPRMNIVYLPNDHTSGLSRGAFTPFAAVADNDYALGMLVQHLSESPVWKESVVFVIEDDAQDGPDHVDAHRSIAFLAGGFVRRHFVDHTMYSTSSMLRTIELILGLPPMSQYDAAAVPMWRSFSSTADPAGYLAIPPGIDLEEKNTAMNELMRRSEEFDLTGADRVPDREFNRLVWEAVKGAGAVMPPVHRSAFLTPERENK